MKTCLLGPVGLCLSLLPTSPGSALAVKLSPTRGTESVCYRDGMLGPAGVPLLERKAGSSSWGQSVDERAVLRERPGDRARTAPMDALLRLRGEAPPSGCPLCFVGF